MLTNDKLKKELLNYKNVGIYKNVCYNQDVNKIDGDFDDTKAGKMLDTFLEKVSLDESCFNTNVNLQKMVVAAKNQRKSITHSLPQGVVDSILVDYINYVAKSCGVNYSLRPYDIR